jgi:predicted metallo-beta-lactamase superfamily hydrolase
MQAGFDAAVALPPHRVSLDPSPIRVLLGEDETPRQHALRDRGGKAAALKPASVAMVTHYATEAKVNAA